MLTPRQGEEDEGPDFEAKEGGFFGAHFYAPAKWVAGVRIPTFWANMGVLWLMSIAFALALRAELFPRIVERLSRQRNPA